MSPGLAIAAITLAAVLAMMLAEAKLSRYNERVMRSRGAIEPPGDVYRLMRLAYPASFVAMAIEGAVAGPASIRWLLFGLGLFGAAKALKFWVIFTLRTRWTFRLLVIPGAPLVSSGPYRLLRHPNYLAVCGELIGFALVVGSPVTGAVGFVVFGALMASRAVLEDSYLRTREKSSRI
jgi:methyltransferase